MAALENDPVVRGSVEIPRLPGIRASPTRLGRTRVEPARRVRAPRHLIVYRVGADAIVEVPGVIRDRMVLSRAARRAAHQADKR